MSKSVTSALAGVQSQLNQSIDAQLDVMKETCQTYAMPSKTCVTLADGSIVEVERVAGDSDLEESSTLRIHGNFLCDDGVYREVEETFDLVQAEIEGLSPEDLKLNFPEGAASADIESLADVLESMNRGRVINETIARANSLFMSSSNVTTSDVLAMVNTYSSQLDASDAQKLVIAITGASHEGKLSSISWATILSNVLGDAEATTGVGSLTLDTTRPFALQSFLSTVLSIISLVVEVVAKALGAVFAALGFILAKVIQCIPMLLEGEVGNHIAVDPTATSGNVKGPPLYINYGGRFTVNEGAPGNGNDKLYCVHAPIGNLYAWANSSTGRVSLNGYVSPTWHFGRTLALLGSLGLLYAEDDEWNWSQFGYVNQPDTIWYGTAATFTPVLWRVRHDGITDFSRRLYDAMLTTEEQSQVLADPYWTESSLIFDSAIADIFGLDTYGEYDALRPYSVGPHTIPLLGFPTNVVSDSTIPKLLTTWDRWMPLATSGVPQPPDSTTFQPTARYIRATRLLWLARAINILGHGVYDHSYVKYAYGDTKRIQSLFNEWYLPNGGDLEGAHWYDMSPIDVSLNGTAIPVAVAKNPWLVACAPRLMEDDTFWHWRFHVYGVAVSRLYEVEGVPTDFSIEIPDFTTKEVVAATIFSAVVVTAAAIATSAAVKRISASLSIKKTKRVASIKKKREAYLADPENKQLKKEYTSSLGWYNFQAGLFGWNKMDGVTGLLVPSGAAVVGSTLLTAAIDSTAAAVKSEVASTNAAADAFQNGVKLEDIAEQLSSLKLLIEGQPEDESNEQVDDVSSTSE